jgi:hypothetical protein
MGSCAPPGSATFQGPHHPPWGLGVDREVWGGRAGCRGAFLRSCSGAQAGLALRPSCLSLPCAGITRVRHHPAQQLSFLIILLKPNSTKEGSCSPERPILMGVMPRSGWNGNIWRETEGHWLGQDTWKIGLPRRQVKVERRSGLREPREEGCAAPGRAPSLDGDSVSPSSPDRREN